MVTQRSGTAAAGAENILGDDPRPVFFAVDRPDALGLDGPPAGGGESVRVWARSLSGMQKEAIVRSTAGGAWRLASDEGPYLDGYDAAPCPLAFMTVGMVSSWMNAVLDAARARGVMVRDLVLVQDNRYTMEGSALNGTMTGGALPVELDVRIDADARDDAVRELVEEATRAASACDVLRRPHVSRFSLAVNGAEAEVGRAARLDGVRPLDPAAAFSRAAPADPVGVPVVRLEAVEPVAGVAGGAGTSLRAEQRRQLHVRAICRRRSDGVKEIEQQLHRPLGSTFRFLSDEPPEQGGSGAAPSAASYMAAGVAFCFMTQLGRYAAILRKDLHGYRIVQDTRFPGRVASAAAPSSPAEVPSSPAEVPSSVGAAPSSVGAAPVGPGAALSGAAGGVEAHVYLDTREGVDFARRCLGMGEQTCFLHALYRTPLEPVVTTTRV